MLPHIAGRPVTMERFHRGIGEKGFFQKNVDKGAPKWLERVAVPKKDGVVNYPIMTRRAWHCLARESKLHHAACVDVARSPALFIPTYVCSISTRSMKTSSRCATPRYCVRDMLAELGCTSWVKTSGSKGFHVAVPLDGSADSGRGRALRACGRPRRRAARPGASHPGVLQVGSRRTDSHRHRTQRVRRDVRGDVCSSTETARAGVGAMHVGGSGERPSRTADVHASGDGSAHRRRRRALGRSPSRADRSTICADLRPGNAMPSLRITYIGGPTALLEFGGLRLLTDPTLDPAGTDYPTPVYTLHKTQSPAINPAALGDIDLVLLSHDHHFDNLDHAGRASLVAARSVLTTKDGADRLGANAIGLAPWESTEFRSLGGGALSITATPARHGPAGRRPWARHRVRPRELRRDGSSRLRLRRYRVVRGRVECRRAVRRRHRRPEPRRGARRGRGPARPDFQRGRRAEARQSMAERDDRPASLRGVDSFHRRRVGDQGRIRRGWNE